MQGNSSARNLGRTTGFLELSPVDRPCQGFPTAPFGAASATSTRCRGAVWRGGGAVAELVVAVVVGDGEGAGAFSIVVGVAAPLAPTHHQLRIGSRAEDRVVPAMRVVTTNLISVNFVEELLEYWIVLTRVIKFMH